MACPRGQIINPQTLRCIRAKGRIAKELLRDGVIDERNIAYGLEAAGPNRTVRRTVRAGRQNVRGVPIDLQRIICPPGKERNPVTGRCIRVGGRLHRQVRREVVERGPIPQPLPQPPPFQQYGYPYPYAYPYYPPPPPAPVPVQPATVAQNVPLRPLPRDAIPIGSVAIAPEEEKTEVLAWTNKNCRNFRDPITGKVFSSLPKEELHDIVRLHTGDCVTAHALSERVADQHRVGKTATLPDKSGSFMTLDDFRVMRDAIRRRRPRYRIPGRRHQPAPADWQLYVASDARSGPNFASVAYVDTSRGVMSADGTVQYPSDAIRVDLGFLPLIRGEGMTCSIKTIVEVIQQLAEENKLLTQVSGGWAPILGFPYMKEYWITDTIKKLNRLCNDLVRKLGSPL